MNLFPACQTVLYTISTALLYPVVICLILLCIWLLVYAGGFAAEWIKRRRMNPGVARSMAAIRAQKKLPEALAGELPRRVTAYAEALSLLTARADEFTPERVEALNQKAQLELFKEVDRIRLIVRTGPSLGLMGTLIPMGTGLAGLTQGNMAQLSSSLILAFTTTVVGLFLGISAHFFSVIKEQWAMEDLRHINLITEAMTRTDHRELKRVKAA
ncbi:MAG: MotA/TolQ/ExbB proton channel family protein [Desulfobacter sp.]|nr:MAG: MotA/TolQ/ExbB proton channel family protein [Desulfobacter sp.]